MGAWPLGSRFWGRGPPKKIGSPGAQFPTSEETMGDELGESEGAKPRLPEKEGGHGPSGSGASACIYQTYFILGS